jgi:hypothetical protein
MTAPGSTDRGRSRQTSAEERKKAALPVGSAAHTHARRKRQTPRPYWLARRDSERAACACVCGRTGGGGKKRATLFSTHPPLPARTALVRLKRFDAAFALLLIVNLGPCRSFFAAHTKQERSLSQKKKSCKFFFGLCHELSICPVSWYASCPTTTPKAKRSGTPRWRKRPMNPLPGPEHQIPCNYKARGRYAMDEWTTGGLTSSRQ